uniref:Uncharacterized protein n=1 Tax=Leersia perrieri TaxID=77586 RepID=A0A0D9WF33_9ORYZ
MVKPTLPSTLLLLPLLLLLISAISKPVADATCTMPPCQGKQSWPELLDKDDNTAYITIKRENPQVTDVVFLISNSVDLEEDGDFCCNRVVVVIADRPGGGEWVTKVPQVG